MRKLIQFLCLLYITTTGNGFYLPGLAPVTYCPKSEATENCKVSHLFVFDFLCIHFLIFVYFLLYFNN